MLLARLALVVALATAAGAVPAEAGARARYGAERSGDATGFRLDPDRSTCHPQEHRVRGETSTDITSLDVVHADGEVRVTVTLRDLLDDPGQGTSITLQTDRHTFSASVSSPQGGDDPGAFLIEAPESPPAGGCFSYDAGPACDSLVSGVDPTLDVVTVVVPDSCLRARQWVRVGASTVRVVRGVLVSDVWDPPGARSTSYGPVGPKVT